MLPAGTDGLSNDAECQFPRGASGHNGQHGRGWEKYSLIAGAVDMLSALACQAGVGVLVGASAGVAWACVLRAPCAQGWFEALARSRLGCLLQLESGRGGSRMKCAPSTVAATQPSSREKQT